MDHGFVSSSEIRISPDFFISCCLASYLTLRGVGDLKKEMTTDIPAYLSGGSTWSNIGHLSGDTTESMCVYILMHVCASASVYVCVPRICVPMCVCGCMLRVESEEQNQSPWEMAHPRIRNETHLCNGWRETHCFFFFFFWGGGWEALVVRSGKSRRHTGASQSVWCWTCSAAVSQSTEKAQPSESCSVAEISLPLV